MVENYHYNTTRVNKSSSSYFSSAPTQKEIEKKGFPESDFLTSRNSITGKNEMINSEIKKELRTLRVINPEIFTQKVVIFKKVIDLIVANKLYKYMYYPIRNYDFMQFIKKMNWFCEKTDLYDIIRKLGKKDELKAIDRILQGNNPNNTINANTLQIVDKNLAKATLQKAAAKLKTGSQKQNLLLHFLQP